MRTIPEIEKEIEQISKVLLADEKKKEGNYKKKEVLTDRQITRYLNQIAYKRKMILYLEHNPMETALRRDLGTYQMLLDRHNEGFAGWVERQNLTAKKTKSEYDKQGDIKNVRDKVSTLRYLIN